MSIRIRTSEKYFKYITSIIAIMGVIIGLFSQYYSSKNDLLEKERSSYLSLKYRMILDSLTMQLMNQREEFNKLYHSEITKKDTISNFRFNEYFKKIDSRVDKLSEQFIGLRQAINPTKPEEIITIARLKDALEILDKKHDKLERDLNANLESFKSSVIREINSMNSSTNWVFLVLIPIVLNLFYTIWKDFRETKVKQKEVA